MREDLVASGMILTPEHGLADVVLLNTCTVTAAADSQAREAIRKIHRSNPAARIVVTGCYAQRAPEELANIEGVSCVVGNSHQSEIPRLVSDPSFLQSVPHDGAGADPTYISLSQLGAGEMSLARGPAKILTGDIFAQTVLQPGTTAAAGGDRTRPILKIQDGCSNRCSYCVIPLVRGRSRSLTPDFVIKEVEKLVSSGAREIVLSGINLGSYGRDLSPRKNLHGWCHESSLKRKSTAFASAPSNPWTLRRISSRWLLPLCVWRRIFTFLCNQGRTASFVACAGGIKRHTMQNAFRLSEGLFLMQR